jgi:ferritin-like protein
MTKENEQLTQGEKHNDEPQHTSWFNAILDRVQDLDIDFPLSGGEGHHVTHRYYSDGKLEATETHPIEESNEKPEQSDSWLTNIMNRIYDLNTDFPLSGGDHDSMHHN